MPRTAVASKHSVAAKADPIATVESHVSRAESLCNRGDYAGALAAADALLSENPDLLSACLLRATACVALRRFADAAEAYRTILSQFPEFTAMHLNLAAVCIELEDLETAESHILQAIAQNPALAAAHANLGSLYMRADQYDLAEAPTRRALELDPTLVTAHQNLAAILGFRNSPDAKTHRDAAYSRQQVFLEPSPGAPRTVLILTSSGSGNVPYQYLLPRDAYGRILWHVEYAPQGQASRLPPHDFVFNAVGDPDAAPEALRAVKDFAAQRALLNPPDRVARTLRSAMPALVGSIADVLVPETRRFESADGDIATAIVSSGLRFPLILRPAGRHGGDGVQLAHSEAELAGKIPDSEAIYATEFVDYRSADGWYRKYRVIFVDREPYPYHLAIGRRWLLHYKSAAMRADTALRAEEENFLRNSDLVLSPRIMTALRTIAATIDLDYAGIDFSLLPDGRLLFFEANATMLVHPEADAMFAYKNSAVESIVSAMGAMISRLSV
jgi:tetratricopeptide (TPR) repeat protein